MTEDMVVAALRRQHHGVPKSLQMCNFKGKLHTTTLILISEWIWVGFLVFGSAMGKWFFFMFVAVKTNYKMISIIMETLWWHVDMFLV